MSTHNDDLGFASPAAILQYLRFANAQGLNSSALLQQVGIEPSLLQTESSRIEGRQFQLLIQQLLNQCSTPILGLLSGDFVEPGSYNVLGFITMNCTTLGEAIMRIAPFEKLVGDMGTTQVSALGEEVHVLWHCRYPIEAVKEQMVDNVFASWINYAKWLGNNHTDHPVRVELERCAPDEKYLKEYQQRWHCPVLFDCPKNKIVIDKSLLQRPLRQPNPDLLQTLELHAQSKLATFKNETKLVDLVRHSLRQQLLTGVMSQEQTAKDLALSLRTLQRKLSQEQVKYQDILAEERFAKAQLLLKQNTLSIDEIAERLGFTETTSFYRSFKKWAGITPAEFKATYD